MKGSAAIAELPTGVDLIRWKEVARGSREQMHHVRPAGV